jgi:hypothetical protein
VSAPTARAAQDALLPPTVPAVDERRNGHIWDSPPPMLRRAPPPRRAGQPAGPNLTPPNRAAHTDQADTYQPNRTTARDGRRPLPDGIYIGTETALRRLGRTRPNAEFRRRNGRRRAARRLGWEFTSTRTRRASERWKCQRSSRTGKELVVDETVDLTSERRGLVAARDPANEPIAVTTVRRTVQDSGQTVTKRQEISNN